MIDFYLKNSHALAQTTELMQAFGDQARGEASARAFRSRDRGNVSGFCHWRQIERAIAALSDEDVTGTVH